jgi:sec-independent protein translocase protein TatA
VGDIGFPELIVILVIALVFFGGGKLPEAGRSLGQAIREFKRGMHDLPPDPIEKKADDDSSSKA